MDSFGFSPVKEVAACERKAFAMKLQPSSDGIHFANHSNRTASASIFKCAPSPARSHEPCIRKVFRRILTFTSMATISNVGVFGLLMRPNSPRSRTAFGCDRRLLRPGRMIRFFHGGTSTLLKNPGLDAIAEGPRHRVPGGAGAEGAARTSLVSIIGSYALVADPVAHRCALTVRIHSDLSE